MITRHALDVEADRRPAVVNPAPVADGSRREAAEAISATKWRSRIGTKAYNGRLQVFLVSAGCRLLELYRQQASSRSFIVCRRLHVVLVTARTFLRLLWQGRQ